MKMLHDFRVRFYQKTLMRANTERAARQAFNSLGGEENGYRLEQTKELSPGRYVWIVLSALLTGCAGAVYDPHDTHPYDMTNPATLDALEYSCEAVPVLPDVCTHVGASADRQNLYYCTSDVTPRTCPRSTTFVQFVPDDRTPSGGVAWCCGT